jgi:hypothetical protein
MRAYPFFGSSKPPVTTAKNRLKGQCFAIESGLNLATWIHLSQRRGESLLGFLHRQEGTWLHSPIQKKNMLQKFDDYLAESGCFVLCGSLQGFGL